MRTNYFKFDLFPSNGQPVVTSLNASFLQLIQANTQIALINGVYYSIHHVSGNVFMFLKTNNTDIIKTIDRANNQYQDISALLQQNQDIAFASYIYISQRCIGFGSTIYGPKIGAFSAYYDHFFFNTNNNRNIRFESIRKSVTPAQALQFAHMGKINVKLEASSPFAIRELTNFLGVTPVEFDDVDSFEIIIKPKHMKNIKDAIVPTLNNLPAGVREMTIAAKQALGDQAIELHVATTGGVYDIVNPKANIAIHLQMSTNFANNADLRASGY
ncbi:TPA: hypothetical protein M2P66_000071 [Klebsiella quasipneumoniae]|uniref:hypothetical protein n=1 Tax=Rouxiella badensis TaxID=1646377 RepID=UPI0013EF52AD|nr:hypothetical protein [Rouxiella badensis]QII38381.1 hypothetical protein G3M83_12195 [Rouxiella badensis]HDK6220002.1 hypothetical protein [Klebsiella quasipneumoniae]